ncbi:hypothetical protein Q2K16_19930 [Micromonospora sp. HUAS LYJ1]|nr:hypothetical protein [Micromonospora sp. HUAS LYJ1]WKU03142.1 hypothetical protein Q2K16_19930 [Micromonospora sp. HUAS LYJ1]
MPGVEAHLFIHNPVDKLVCPPKDRTPERRYPWIQVIYKKPVDVALRQKEEAGTGTTGIWLSVGRGRFLLTRKNSRKEGP